MSDSAVPNRSVVGIRPSGPASPATRRCLRRSAAPQATHRAGDRTEVTGGQAYPAGLGTSAPYTHRAVSPEISVVIATHNRPRSLAALLRSLAEQTLERDRFEVVVVDDGSEAAADVERMVSGVDGLDVTLLRHERARGHGAARNAGWRQARAPLVAFTDDDCRASREWLSAILDTAASQEASIVQGRVEPAPEQLSELRPLSHTIVVVGLNRLFETCNVAYSRTLLDRLGGFDEALVLSGEDVDLGARAVKAGGRAAFAERAVVYHEVRQLGLRGMIRHTRKWVDAPRVLRRHPELRELLVARVFWKPTHPRLLLALAGVATGARTRRVLPAVLAAGPYLAYYRRLYPGPLRPALNALPAHMVIDLCEVLTVAWGSIRYRAVML